ncbi:hypothetical protein R3P38DRAFT_3203701 [Favolaschia claudopus]|uniref:Uncharacterized protein n=1 Tax=Favolaschia claudopus TaxID=2862362 RepID=A0AAW0ASF3_9AGAR
MHTAGRHMRTQTRPSIPPSCPRFTDSSEAPAALPEVPQPPHPHPKASSAVLVRCMLSIPSAPHKACNGPTSYLMTNLV